DWCAAKSNASRATMSRGAQTRIAKDTYSPNVRRMLRRFSAAVATSREGQRGGAPPGGLLKRERPVRCDGAPSPASPRPQRASSVLPTLIRGGLNGQLRQRQPARRRAAGAARRAGWRVEPRGARAHGREIPRSFHARAALRPGEQDGGGLNGVRRAPLLVYAVAPRWRT